MEKNQNKILQKIKKSQYCQMTGQFCTPCECSSNEVLVWPPLSDVIEQHEGANGWNLENGYLMLNGESVAEYDVSKDTIKILKRNDILTDLIIKYNIRIDLLN